jgi:hypothetical protein
MQGAGFGGRVEFVEFCLGNIAARDGVASARERVRIVENCILLLGGVARQEWTGGWDVTEESRGKFFAFLNILALLGLVAMRGSSFRVLI